MHCNFKPCQILGILTGGVLCLQGILLIVISLWFIFYLHPMHLLFQAFAGISSIICGAWGIVFNKKLVHNHEDVKTLGIRVTLVINFIIHGIALGILILDRAGYDVYPNTLFPSHNPPAWTLAINYVPEGILILTIANSTSMVMDIILLISSFTCFHNKSDMNDTNIMSTRWVWKETNRSNITPISVKSVDIISQKSKNKSDTNVILQNKHKNVCKMTSFRPLSKENNQGVSNAECSDNIVGRMSASGSLNSYTSSTFSSNSYSNLSTLPIGTTANVGSMPFGYMPYNEQIAMDKITTGYVHN